MSQQTISAGTKIKIVSGNVADKEFTLPHDITIDDGITERMVDGEMKKFNSSNQEVDEDGEVVKKK